MDFLSGPEPSRNKLNHHKTPVFPGCLLLSKVARASLLEYIYKKIMELLQNSASEGERAHDKGRGREGGKKAEQTLCFADICGFRVS